MYLCIDYTRLPLDKSKDVTRPWTSISVCGFSVLVSQNRILLSKWPLMMVVPTVSDVTRSLQLDIANLVSTPTQHIIIAYNGIRLIIIKITTSDVLTISTLYDRCTHTYIGWFYHTEPIENILKIIYFIFFCYIIIEKQIY